MFARPAFRALRSTSISGLCLAFIASVSVAAEPAADAPLLTEESLREFMRLYDPDVPVSFRDDEPAGASRSGGRTALAPNESFGGSWWSGFAAAPAGQGLQSSVNAMAEYGGGLVVGGDFRRAAADLAHRVAIWNGATWSPVGSGMNHRVFALHEFEGDLIAGGAFTRAGGTPANFVAAWDGSSWSPLDHGPGGPVYTLEVHQGVLYAGGDFPGFLASWDGTTWVPAPVTPNGIVAALASVAEPDTMKFGPTLFAGGVMLRWGNQGANTGAFIFRRSGTSPTWIRVNGGANNWVNAMHVVRDTLYAGGNFSEVRNLVNPRIVAVGRVVGFAFPVSASRPAYFALGDPTGNGLNDAVLAISDLAGTVVVGGQFDTATGPGGMSIVANRIATWDGVQWGTLGTGMSGGLHPPYVRALQTFGTDLYAGGWFTSAGGLNSRHIARWIDVPEPETALSVLPADDAAGLIVTVAPNPFALETRISFSSPEPASVTLSVHDVRGRRIRTLLDADRVEGMRTASWDGRDEEGHRLAAGVYFVRLERDGVPSTGRVVLAR